MPCTARTGGAMPCMYGRKTSPTLWVGNVSLWETFHHFLTHFPDLLVYRDSFVPFFADFPVFADFPGFNHLAGSNLLVYRQGERKPTPLGVGFRPTQPFVVVNGWVIPWWMHTRTHQGMRTDPWVPHPPPPCTPLVSVPHPAARPPPRNRH